MDNVIYFYYLDLDPTNVWFINGIIARFHYYIFVFIFKKFTSDLKSLGSLRSARIKEFDMRRFCYLCAMIRRNTEVASATKTQVIKN